MVNFAQPGYIVGYYFTCKRRCWFALRHIRCEDLNELVKLGKVITKHHEFRGKREVELERCKLDLMDVKKGIVFEIKLSKKPAEGHIMQLKYYLFKLKQSGHDNPVGILKLYSGRRQLVITLTENDENILERTEVEIEALKNTDKPPPPTKLPFCKKCSYYELCWI